MRTVALGLLALALSVPAMSTPITGDVAIAGASTYTLTGIEFTAPSVTLIATGNFLPLLGGTVNPHNLTFAAAPGFTLFSDAGITMDILTLAVITNDHSFLNVAGTAHMMEAGFDTTLFDFTLTATRPDGVSSYTLTATPAAVPEPAALFLVGTGLLALGLLYRAKRQA